MQNLPAATLSDGYKVGHAPMYADGTDFVYSNLTPRSDKHYLKGATAFYDGKLVFVGLQGAIQEIEEYWNTAFFNLKKESAIQKYARRMSIYLGGEVDTTARLAELHDLGYLPIEVRALKEGSKVPMGVPVFTIHNTKPEFFWLVNYLETILSALIWKPSTNATIASEYRAIVEHFGDLTGVDKFTQSIQCHDFSFRGMSGPEDAARSGFAHLTSFIGTDTLPAMDYAELYYDAPDDSLIAISVPATEHAVATSNILHLEKDIKRHDVFSDADDRMLAEYYFMRELITRKFPKGIVSYVADSFDYWSVLRDILPLLREEINSREPAGPAPGKLVIRPDSGDPVKVICGYKLLNIQESEFTGTYKDVVSLGYDGVVSYGTPLELDKDGKVVRVLEWYEVKGSIQILWEIFGGTKTATGYKLLDPHIGLIYGDSITTQRAVEILSRLEANGFASGNVVFGVGSYTYQHSTRDTFGFAVKATYSSVDGEGFSIFKDPKTDSKKKSAKGLLYVVRKGEEFELLDDQSPDLVFSEENELKVVYRDGEWVKRTSLEDIRETLGTSVA